MLCSVYKDIQQLVTILVHPKFATCLKNTPQQPNNTQRNSVETVTLLNNSLRPMPKGKFPFTSKPRQWFPTLRLQIAVRTDTIRLWDTTLCASRQTEQCLTHRLMCVCVCVCVCNIYILHFVFLYPATTRNNVAFPWNRDFPVILFIL